MKGSENSLKKSISLNKNSKIVCTGTCKKEKPDTQYYLSNNPLYKNSNYKFPVCKVCLKEKINVENIDTVKDILMQLNRPFIESVWQSSIDESKKTNRDLFGLYYKNIALNYKNHGYKESLVLNQTKNSVLIDEEFNISTPDFKVTSEMIIRWGQNYSPNEYLALEDFYHNMKRMNKIETPQEEVYLKKLASISVKMDRELEAGNYGQVKQLGDLFSKYMGDSKFRAMDKSEIDKTGGMRNFGTIFAEVEKEDHIPPWEEYRVIKNLKQDIVDLTIMHIENFTLRLNKIDRMVEPPSDTPKINEVDDNLEGDI